MFYYFKYGSITRLWASIGVTRSYSLFFSFTPHTSSPFSLPLPHPLSPHRDPLAQLEVEKREHEVKMHKMEQEMEEVFEMKVQEKLQKLKDIEADVSWREGQGSQRIDSNGEWERS